MLESFDKLCQKTMSQAALRRSDRRAKQILASLFLREIRQAVGLSQVKMAKALGIKQPSLSKLENQPDMQITTLRRLVSALGGELEVIAHFPRGAVRIEQFDDPAAPPSRPRRPRRPQLV